MHPRTQQIENVLAKARINLTRLHAERDAAFLDLLKTPESPALIATLDQLRIEIPQAEGRVAELESVLATAKVSDTAEARAAERVRLQELRTEAVTLAKRRVTLAAKIDHAVADLGELLAAWAEAGEPITESVHLMTKAACPNSDKRMNYAGDLLRIADGTSDNFRGALIGQLINAGLFRKGIFAMDIQLEHLCSGTRAPLAQVAEITTDRLHRILCKFDAMADERLGKLP